MMEPVFVLTLSDIFGLAVLGVIFLVVAYVVVNSVIKDTIKRISDWWEKR